LAAANALAYCLNTKMFKEVAKTRAKMEKEEKNVKNQNKF
jgi:hypothetical protein